MKLYIHYCVLFRNLRITRLSVVRNWLYLDVVVAILFHRELTFSSTIKTVEFVNYKAVKTGHCHFREDND